MKNIGDSTIQSLNASINNSLMTQIDHTTHEIKKDGGLYWITYTVTDKAGNKTRKTQRIEFEEK